MYRQFIHTLGVILLLIGLSSTASAQLLKKGFETIYEVHHNNIYLGDTVRKLSAQENGQWIYSSHTEAKGFVSMFVKDRIEEKSTLEITPDGIKPLTYHYDQSGGKRVRQFLLEFNWDKNKLNNTFLKQELPLAPGTQDLLSFLLQIMVQMQGNKEFIEMPIADKRRIDDYQLRLVARENVETPFKTLPAIVMMSNKIKGKMQFKLWCAPSLQYLPIKIQKIEDDGDEDVLSLKQLTIAK